MKAILALVLVVLLVVCAQSRRTFARPFPGKGIKPRWVNKKDFTAPADDEESDFWMALAPLAINLIKNKLSKRDESDDEEADFINWKKIGEVAKNVGKSYLSSKYGINLDEEVDQDEDESDIFITFIPNKKLHHRDEADDDEDEESDFINWKKIGSIAKDIGKTYLSSKYGINLDEEEESDSEFFGKINWGKIGNIAKDIGKTYLSSKYGINLDEEVDAEEESDFINWKKIGGIAKDIGKTYLSSKYGINLDDEDEEESEVYRR